MSFDVTLGAQSLKAFTKCLACLARYGDDVILQADSNSLSLSSINSSKSAFGQVKFSPSFFEKYIARVHQPPGSTFSTPPSQPDPIQGQLMAKSLLSILKHKTIDKIIERCRLSIPEPGRRNDDDSDEEKDSLEFRLIIRLYCKHGIVKTHKLVLLTPTNVLTPRIPSVSSESRVVIGPRALKDILEHFSHTKGPKYDPQLLWMFGPNDVKVKTYQSNADAKAGKAQYLSTEISINADEFESYQIHDPPLSIGFHLKEFNATIVLAEALSTALDIRFIGPTEPILIEFESDATYYELLFIISTTNNTYGHVDNCNNNLRKRQRIVEDTEMENSENGSSSRAGKRKSERLGPNTPPSPSSVHITREESSVLRSSNLYQAKSPDGVHARIDIEARLPSSDMPLFLPGASQASHGAPGVEHLAYEDFEAMMDAEAEVGMSTKVRIMPMTRNSLRNVEDDRMEESNEMLPATQPIDSNHNKFQPLFDD